jgi:protein TonB
MFGVAEEHDCGGFEPSSSAAAARPEIARLHRDLALVTEATEPPPSRSRYGEDRQLNWPAIIVTTALHAAAFAAALLVGFQVVAKKEAPPRLTVVNLTPPPPPPSAATPPPARPDIVAPIPPLLIAHNPPPMATTPDPAPTQPSPVSSVVGSPAVSVPVVAAPSPPSVVQDSALGAKMVSGAPPRYPMESRRHHEQGTVVLSVTLGIDGKVSSIAVSQSSGFSRLDDAALSAVRKWRWTPITRDGKPVMVRGMVEIPFVLVA